VLTAVAALAGNFTAGLDFQNALLALLTPLEGQFTITFSHDAHVDAYLSMSGDFGPVSTTATPAQIAAAVLSEQFASYTTPGSFGAEVARRSDLQLMAGNNGVRYAHVVLGQSQPITGATAHWITQFVVRVVEPPDYINSFEPQFISGAVAGDITEFTVYDSGSNKYSYTPSAQVGGGTGVDYVRFSENVGAPGYYNVQFYPPGLDAEVEQLARGDGFIHIAYAGFAPVAIPVRFNRITTEDLAGGNGSSWVRTTDGLKKVNVQVEELHKLQGLDAANPMTVSATTRTVDTITLDITTGGGGDVTVTRQP
jgi:hypothetical protein